jgi:ABC-type glutathione transport system ATPase component
MRDDFAALDFLSAGSFRWSPRAKQDIKPRRTLFALRRRRIAATLQRPLSALAGRMAVKRQFRPALQGWAVALSWPALEADATRPDYSL